MTIDAGDDERMWAADKRDFVAEWRDGVADTRDGMADAREREADAREAYLEKWERRLVARAAELGVPLDAVADEVREHDGSQRYEASVERGRAEQDRERESVARDDATRQRDADSHPTQLAMAFATITERLYDADTVDDVLLRIAQAAVTSLDGCGVASVTLSDGGSIRTAASTDPAASAVDSAQYESGEGPTLDALSTSVVHVPAFPDERYPTLGARPVEAGVRSAVAYHLTASSPSSPDPIDGALTAYGLADSSFDDAAREIGLVLAAHASVATRQVGRRESLEQAGQELREALMSRDVIGQAKGILMERLKVSPDAAFDMLRRASMNLNVKLREVAAKLTETGKL